MWREVRSSCLWRNQIIPQMNKGGKFIDGSLFIKLLTTMYHLSLIITVSVYIEISQNVSVFFVLPY